MPWDLSLHLHLHHTHLQFASTWRFCQAAQSRRLGLPEARIARTQAQGLETEEEGWMGLGVGRAVGSYGVRFFFNTIRRVGLF